MLTRNKILLVVAVILSFIGICAFSMVYTDLQGDQEYRKQFAIREGIMANHARTIKFRENGKVKAKVKLYEPVLVSKSESPMEWGYYQFPSIYRMDDGNLLITWQMKEDDHKTLGGKDKGKNMMLSQNNGRTWIDYDNRYRLDQYYYSYKNKEGDSFLINSAVSKAISSLNNIPKPVYQFDQKGKKSSFYKESELPDDLQGVILKKWKSDGSNSKGANSIRLSYNDNGLYKCAIDDHMLLWVGRLIELSNRDVLVYDFTSYHADNYGRILPLGISFYKLSEQNKSLDFQGEMPYLPDKRIDPIGNTREDVGFSEPTVVEMSDGKLLCVARSTLETVLTPLYKSVSSDEGKTWSKPEPFTPNGVDPSLIRLGNGTLVLISGRPGVQLRFCFDGEGINWTEPVEMIHFPYDNGKLDTFGGSCGYTDILPYDNNSFFIVYSVFDKADNNNANGKNVLFKQYKKSIMFRKITVKVK